MNGVFFKILLTADAKPCKAMQSKFYRATIKIQLKVEFAVKKTEHG